MCGSDKRRKKRAARPETTVTIEQDFEIRPEILLVANSEQQDSIF
jgi:hypothetical protein